MNCIAEQIKNLMTMRQLIERYNIAQITRNNTIKCPFHNEKTASCRLYENSFYCFGCGKGDDLIMFTQLYFNINFQQAILRLNYDFALGLPVGRKLTQKEKEDIRDKTLRLEAKREFEDLLKEIKSQKYYNALSNYEQVMKDIYTFKPVSIEECEQIGFNDNYVNALHRKDYVSFLLDLQELERGAIYE